MPGRRFQFVHGSHREQQGTQQPGLVVGTPGDRYEREADRIARAVARGDSGPGVRGVQPFGGPAGGAAPRDADVHGQVRAAVAGARGQRIPGQVRAPLEHALGADLGGVRVHADAGADRLSRSLRASALTTGQDIFFRQGSYAPGSREGNALLAHELVHVLQQRACQPGPAQAVQLSRPEDYRTYAKAKNANKYSKALLDRQKSDLLEEHIDKEFSEEQRDRIYKVNKKVSESVNITSDTDGMDLFLQDTDTTPHIDHRYPKSKKGRNTFVNAAVIPARANIRKSSKLLDLKAEPTVALPPYQKLKDTGTVLPGKEFSQDQKNKIYAANMAFYKKGSIVSDDDGTTLLEKYDSSQVPHVDHITPRTAGGSNYYFNASVISAEENIEKGGQRGGSRGEDDYDWQELKMNLEEFIDFKRTGTVPDRFLQSSSSDEESSGTEEEEHTRQKRSRSDSDPGTSKRGRKRSVSRSRSRSRSSSR